MYMSRMRAIIMLSSTILEMNRKRERMIRVMTCHAPEDMRASVSMLPPAATSHRVRRAKPKLE